MDNVAERSVSLGKSLATKTIMSSPTHAIQIPTGQPSAALRASSRTVSLTNLEKMFWPGEGITKGELLQYYADVAPFLLPHLTDRAIVMKHYPNGVAGEFFFQNHVPEPHPEWIPTCQVKHESAQGNRLSTDSRSREFVVGGESRQYRSQSLVCSL